jgi:hypothetical protein
MALVAKRIVAPHTAYKDISYWQAFRLSTTFQGGIVAWVAFWSIYGQGVSAENLSSIGAFGIAYMTVILLEPLIDLAVLFGVKTLHRFKGSMLLQSRLHYAA